MKCAFLLFLLFVLTLPAQVLQPQVRVVTFEKSGAATALEATVPDCDEKLYAALSASAVAGEAKIVQDQVLTVRGGQRSKVEGLREFPYPLAGTADPMNWSLIPDQFTFRQAGQSVEVEATVGEENAAHANRLLDLSLAPVSCEFLARNQWPVPDLGGAGRMGSVLRPLFAMGRYSGQVLTCTGLTTLIAVAASPQNAVSSAGQSSFRYSFLRAGLIGEKPENRTPVRGRSEFGQRRLHAVTIRLPRGDAAAMMMRHQGDDAALFDALSRRVAGGTAMLSGHGATLCRDGQRSKVESLAEFSVPVDYDDLIPEGWAARNAGLEFEAEASFGKEQDPRSGWNLSLDMRDGPEMIPYHPDATRPQLHGAALEQVIRQFYAQVSLPASGILCSGILSTSPATASEDAPAGTTDLCFLLQSPPPGKTDANAKPQILLQALMISVSAGEGPALARAGKSADAGRASALVGRMVSGSVRCAAHAGMIIPEGQRRKVSCARTMMQPSNYFPSKAAPDVKVPSDWKPVNCGCEFEAEFIREPDGLRVTGNLKWDTAPVLPFGEPGAEIPPMEERRCVEEISLTKLSLPQGKPVIVDVRPSKARDGTPEHGRWHVLILQASSR